MGRPMGSKNKPKDEIASAAVTAEDLAFERELQAMANELPPVIDDPDPVGSIVKHEPDRPELLRFAVEDYKPAATDLDLREQIHTAKMNDCDSIEATLPLAKRFCKDPSLETVGYFVMHDIKVYVEGAYEKAKARDQQTVEQRNFGGSKIA